MSRTARQPLQRDERLLDHLVHHLRAATRLARVRADTRGLEHASNDLVPDSTLRLEQQRAQLDGDLEAAWVVGEVGSFVGTLRRTWLGVGEIAAVECELEPTCIAITLMTAMDSVALGSTNISCSPIQPGV